MREKQTELQTVERSSPS